MGHRNKGVSEQQMVADADHDERDPDELIAQYVASMQRDAERPECREERNERGHREIVRPRDTTDEPHIAESECDDDRRKREGGICLNGHGEYEHRGEHERRERRPDRRGRLYVAKSPPVVAPGEERQADRRRHERDEPDARPDSGRARSPGQLPVAPGSRQEERNTQGNEAESLELIVSFGHVPEALKTIHVITSPAVRAVWNADRFVSVTTSACVRGSDACATGQSWA